MKWLAASLGILVVITGSGCWRPYYGRNYAPPAVAQPAFGQPTYQQPVVQGQPQIIASPQVMQAAPMMQQQCQPCQPNPCCVPCY